MKEKLEKINRIACYEGLCHMTKEVEEVTIRNLDDAKKLAQLLESKGWVAGYAVTNEDSVTIALYRI